MSDVTTKVIHAARVPVTVAGMAALTASQTDASAISHL
jgi:hypothetical protein